MLDAARAALKAALRDVFPVADVPQLHEGKMPVGFRRPALYIQPVPWSPRHVASDIAELKTRWQVVYFPALDAAGNPVRADLDDATDALVERLGLEKSLTAPDGTVLLLEDFSPEDRDDVITCTLSLCGYLQREAPAVTILGEAEVRITEV